MNEHSTVFFCHFMLFYFSSCVGDMSMSLEYVHVPWKHILMGVLADRWKRMNFWEVRVGLLPMVTADMTDTSTS